MASRARTLTFLAPLLSTPLVLACVGGGGGTTADTTTTTTTTNPPTTDANTEPGPTTTAPTTTDATGTTTTGGTTTTTTEPLTTGTSAGTTTTGGTTGAGLDCDALAAGPFEPEYLGGGFDGSEDLGFDGAGGLALKSGDQVVIVSADFNTELLATGLPQVYGTRFAASGELLIAVPGSGELRAIDPGGDSSLIAADLDGPNGLHVDPGGDVWLTEFGGGRVVRFDADFKNNNSKTIIHEGADATSANGVVFDPARGLLFFTNYGAGRLLKLEIDPQGQPVGAPVEVAVIPGARPDGLVLDACGNLYVVDQGGSRLYRAWLDDQAAIVGAPELLAEFDENVANAQFGWGEGWDPESLYVIGNPGAMYRVRVAVPGAPIGLP